MGSFMANFKGQKAARLQSKGNYDEARKVYAEAYAAGMNDPRLLLAYSVLLIRAYEFEAAKELLVKTQKAPGYHCGAEKPAFHELRGVLLQARRHPARH